MKTFQLPAVLDSYRSLRDRGHKVTFETGELSPQNAADLQSSLLKVGYLAFSPDPFSTAELYEMDSLKVDFDQQKTPGQRLRGVLFKLFEQDAEGYKTFNDYYNSHMEILIEHFKKKIL